MCRIFLLLLSSYLVHCDQIGTTIVVDCRALLNYEQKRVKWTDMVGNFTEAERQHLSDDLQSSIDKNIRHSIFRGALLQTRITAIEEKLNGTVVQVYLYFDTEKLKQLNQNVLANQMTMQKYLRKQFSGHRNGLSLNSVRVLDIYLLEPLEVKAFYCKGTVFSQKESPEQIRNILNRNSPHYMHAVSGITIQFVTSLEQCALDSALKSADTDVVRLGTRKSHPSIQSKAVLEFAYDSLALIDPQFFGLHGAKHLSNMLKTVWKRDQWCHPCADTPWCIDAPSSAEKKLIAIEVFGLVYTGQHINSYSKELRNTESKKHSIITEHLNQSIHLAMQNATGMQLIHHIDQIHLSRTKRNSLNAFVTIHLETMKSLEQCSCSFAVLRSRMVNQLNRGLIQIRSDGFRKVYRLLYATGSGVE